MDERPSVSAVIPCWRCSATVARAVSSVAAQTCDPLEVILVDDASGDGTLEVLHSIARQYENGWVRVIGLRENGGPGPARNAGWEAARGDYIAFLDADDAWHPRKLELHLGWLSLHPEVVLSGTKSLLLKDGVIPAVHEHLDARKINLRQNLFSNQFLTRTVIVKRAIPWRFEGRRITEDFLLWARIIASGAPSYVLDTPLSFSFREEFDPGGYSGNLWTHEARELRALARLHECGDLQFPGWCLFSAWSLCKYVRREWIVRARRRQRAKEARN